MHNKMGMTSAGVAAARMHRKTMVILLWASIIAATLVYWFIGIMLPGGANHDFPEWIILSGYVVSMAIFSVSHVQVSRKKIALSDQIKKLALRENARDALAVTWQKTLGLVVSHMCLLEVPAIFGMTVSICGWPSKGPVNIMCAVSLVGLVAFRIRLFSFVFSLADKLELLVRQGAGKG
jgi:hypothetical protein